MCAQFNEKQTRTLRLFRMLLIFHSQRRKERARTRTAGAQKSSNPHATLHRGHRPGCAGKHALAGLFPRQEQTNERPAVRRVSK